MQTPARRISALLVVTTTALMGVVAPARGQTPPCFEETEETPERYGPTDISAVSGNGGLSVGLNPDATVTVLKWPSPSFYDQIKYRTTDRAEPRFGALPNEGAFFGIAWRPSGSADWKFAWLRTWKSSQSFADDDGDVVVTSFRNRAVGLTVRVSDVVNAGNDLLFREVEVSRTARSKARLVRVVSFANFNPVFSKTAQQPTDDWCTEEDNDEGASYEKGPDAVVHLREGTDTSTGEPSGAALVMGFKGASNGHEVGVDTYQTGADGLSAYDDSTDGVLTRDNSAPGQADTALADDLDLRRSRRDTTTAIIAAAFTRGEALAKLRSGRARTFASVVASKNRWWREWLHSAALPKEAPGPVERLAKRSLITLRQVTDVARSMIVASIATQAPYGVDWIRDGSYINRALEEAGHPDIVAAHDLRYSELQATTTEPPTGGPVTPAGNWAQNYYADGVVGGPIPYEIDETGYGIWTLWDHYAQTKDRDYLLFTQPTLYEAIQRAAHYLTENAPIGCKDPTNNLQCSASEGDNEDPSQTLVGAQAVWLGLDSAVRAARVRGTEESLENADTWMARRNELGDAIHANFFDEGCTCYTTDYDTGGGFLWPVGYLDYGSTRSDNQAAVNWEHMADVFAGKTTTGRFESKLLLGNAYAWKGAAELAKVKRGLMWVARVPTTNQTGLLGEAWMAYPNEESPIATMVSQPHATSHAMFYLAALKTYGSARYSFD